MAGRPLKVTDNATSESIMELLKPGEVVHIECRKRQFSTWHDAYAGNAEALDKIRKDGTLSDFTFYAMGETEARNRQSRFS